MPPSLPPLRALLTPLLAALLMLAVAAAPLSLAPHAGGHAGDHGRRDAERGAMEMVSMPIPVSGAGAASTERSGGDASEPFCLRCVVAVGALPTLIVPRATTAVRSGRRTLRRRLGAGYRPGAALGARAPPARR